jgi:hypothetical protein
MYNMTTTPYTGPNLHAPSGTMFLAIPAAFMGLLSSAQAAADSWEAVLGREIQIVENAGCSPENANCISFKNDHGTLPGDSGCASLATASPSPSGAWNGTTSIRLVPDWASRGAHPGNLQNLIAHELGHYFGLYDRLDASCTYESSVMHYVNCYDTQAPQTGKAIGPSASDAEALIRSTYGNQNRKTCGW